MKTICAILLNFHFLLHAQEVAPLPGDKHVSVNEAPKLIIATILDGKQTSKSFSFPHEWLLNRREWHAFS